MKNSAKKNKPKRRVAKILLFKPREENYITDDQVFKVIENKYPHVLNKQRTRQPFKELVILLLRWRLIHGLSQAEVAKRASCALSTYQLMEEGRPSANPGIKTLWKVAQVYGVDSLKEFWAGPGTNILST